MSAAEEASILANVSSSRLPKRQVLRDLGVPKSTYYRWLKRPRLMTGQEVVQHPGTA